ncbi:MAG TPA: ATP-binding protein [Williamwhitmania sp.]|nr:ATP-binding protein [Williamwhitmania sp.]
MFIQRELQPQLERMLKQFPIVSITGPRQSGKTTLLRNAFPHFKYFNLERLDHRQLIMDDPIGFLRNNGSQVIFDEAQNLPELFSYLQVVSDERNSAGQYILSGSQSFLMNQQITQSLAGRVYVSHLLPYGFAELNSNDDSYNTIFKGFYPRLHDMGINSPDFYPSYLQTYIERDVRTLKAVEDLNTFARFLGLCAGRVGQVLNLTSLANDAGIAVNTAKSWLSLLEASFIIFLLQPYYKNFSKRIIKSPKLYFFDTGLACSLLRISNSEMIKTHYLYGALFENLVISDIMKQFYHSGIRPSVYYWRESNGTEIDCIIERGSQDTLAIEVKAGQTYSKDFLQNFKKFPDKQAQLMVVYTGEESLMTGEISIVNWKKIPKIVEH